MASTDTPANFSSVRIEEFIHGNHMSSTADCLLNVMNHPGSLYPPSQDVSNDKDSLTKWIMEEDVLGRWVALADERVVGHISITKAHDYLENYLTKEEHKTSASLGYSEISKFYTDPAYRKHGIGQQLFSFACQQSWELGYQPALAVVDTSLAAIRFYHSVPLTEVGSFVGIHGTNIVFADDSKNVKN